MRSIWRYGQVMSGLLPAFGLGMAVLAGSAQAQTAPIRVQDDRGRAVVLAEPARRAVTLAPHATELVYAAGAGDRIAATIRGSDYPPAARAAGHRRWHATGRGTRGRRPARPDHRRQPAAAEPLVRVMDKLGVPVYYSDPQTLADIPPRWNGWASCSAPRTGSARRQALRERLDRLAARHADRRPLRVFIQAGLDPIYTLNRTSIVSDALRLCGGVNVFADSPVVAPQVSLESVLAARPDAVLAGVSRQEDKANNLAAGASWPAGRPGRPCTASTPMPCTVPAPA